ncbi:WG repeat-containing protein [Myroides sp. mNGS23_01]|nr:WG repeat-containing protein [Myroides sp. mNGS23_01]WHT40788.1 WG repeat-containing protein [Myroides sp. mNGS23_01]
MEARTLVAIPFADHVVNSSNPDFIIVKQGKKFGIINDKGEVVLPFKYDNLGPLKEGMIPAQQNGYWGYIDEKGKQKIAFTFENALPFSEDGLAGVKFKEWGFIDRTGKIVIPAQYKITAHLFSPQLKDKGFHGGLVRVKYKKNGAFWM